jgi:uncharacterized membrane protein
MTGYQLLLVLHIFAAMVWIGGAATGTIIGMQLRRTGDGGSFGAFCAAFAQVAGPLFGGTAMLVLLSGIGMVAMDGGPAFSDLWVSISFVGWLVSAVMGATIVGGTWTRVAKELHAGTAFEAVQSTIDKAVRLTWIDLAIRTAVVFVMVWKPV